MGWDVPFWSFAKVTDASDSYFAKVTDTSDSYLPKPDGRQRPIGIAALEDKIVQQAPYLLSRG